MIFVFRGVIMAGLYARFNWREGCAEKNRERTRF